MIPTPARIALYAGARAPEAIVLTITRSDPTFDCTGISTASLIVLDEGEDEVDWPATIQSATPSQLVVQHVFDSAGLETATPGRYRVFARLNLLAGGSRRSYPIELTILE